MPIRPVRSYGSFCPVAQGSEVVAQRWVPLILRELRVGYHRFNEIRHALPLISPSVLAQRLKALEEDALIQRRSDGDGVAYHLTPAGEELRPIVDALGQWARKWVDRDYRSYELDPGVLMWSLVVAPENERRFGADMGWMLAGGWFRPIQLGRQYLPPNSRTLGDYGAYITLSGSLWVWTSEMLEEQRATAINDPRAIIYEHQSIMEFLEYGYMLHRALLSGATGPASWAEVLVRRRELLTHAVRLEEASHFGEIRTLLQKGWGLMGLPEIRDRIREALSIRQDEVAAREARQSERTGWALTALFGFLAVPTIATEVLLPLWNLLGPPVRVRPEVLKLLAIAVAALGAGGFTWAVLNVQRRLDNR